MKTQLLSLKYPEPVDVLEIIGKNRKDQQCAVGSGRVCSDIHSYTAMLGQQWLFSDQLTALVRSEILHLPFDDGASAKLCPNSCTRALACAMDQCYSTLLVQRTGWIIQSKSNRSLLFKLSYILEAFNNYVVQILPNFDHLPPSSGQLLTFYRLPTLCSSDRVWTFY